MSQIDRRTVLKAGVLAAVSSPFAGFFAGPAGASPSNQAVPDPAQSGSWSAPFDLGGIAVHAVLTHADDILFFQYVEGTPGVDHTSYVGTWNYRTGVTQQAPFPYERDTFCAGNNILPDGRVYIAGGHDRTTGKRTNVAGVFETDTYDAVTRTWTPRPLLTQKRWYPTNIGLPNGKTLIFGGAASPGVNSTSVDQYDPVSNVMSRLPSTATKLVGNYPRMHLLPDGRIVKTGMARRSAYFDPATNSWSDSGNMLFGGRQFGLSVLLPGCERVLAVGGRGGGNGGTTATVEILNATSPAPKWRYTAPMQNPRVDVNGVLLPDGQVLIVGGELSHPETGPVKSPELFNPATETWTTLAPHNQARMYHSTALLLPDGRVFSAGGENLNAAEEQQAEIFSPPYLFKGPRPTISAAPAAISYGQAVPITTPEADDIASVVLIKASALTHQINTDQRSVPLSFSKTDSTTLSVQMTANANLAPPGYYMLFIVTVNGVPSVAPWVKVG